MATARKRASALTAAEQSRYRAGVTQLIENGFYGQRVALHGDMSHDQHGGMGDVDTLAAEQQQMVSAGGLGSVNTHTPGVG